MEKTQKEILNDIMAELSAIRLALNSLESKLSRIDLSDPEPVELDFDEELDGDLPEEIAEEAPAEAPAEIAEEAPAEPEVELDLFGEPVLRVNEKLGAVAGFIEKCHVVATLGIAAQQRHVGGLTCMGGFTVIFITVPNQRVAVHSLTLPIVHIGAQQTVPCLFLSPSPAMRTAAASPAAM